MKAFANKISYETVKLFINVLALAMALPGYSMEYNSNQFENTNSDSITEVGLFSVDNHLLIKGKLNGKNAYFLLDTGASCTVLHSKLAKHYKYQIFQSLSSRKSIGVNGGSNNKRNTAIDVDLYIGQPTITQAYFTQNLSALNEHIYRISKIRIAGIIGSDLLKRFGCGVDFGNKLLKFN